MEQRVTVIAVNGDEAVVSGRRASACGGCAGKASCSTLGSWKERQVELRVKNSLRAGIGDEVLLAIPDAILLRVAFRLYGLPMLAFVLTGLVIRTVALSADWPLPEVWAATAGLLAVLATYGWILQNSKDASTSGLEARMVRITQSATQFPISAVNEDSVQLH